MRPRCALGFDIQMGDGLKLKTEVGYSPLEAGVAVDARILSDAVRAPFGAGLPDQGLASVRASLDAMIDVGLVLRWR